MDKKRLEHIKRVEKLKEEYMRAINNFSSSDREISINDPQKGYMTFTVKQFLFGENDYNGIIEYVKYLESQLGIEEGYYRKS